MADENPAPSVPPPSPSSAPISPSPNDEAAARAAEASLDTAGATFDSVEVGGTGGGSTPAIDEAALQQLLDLANIDGGGSAAAGDVDSPRGQVAVGQTAGSGGAGGLAGSDAQGFDLPDFQQVIADAAASSIDLLRDVELNVKIELGRSRMLVEDVLKLNEGSVVELDKLAGDPVDVFVNERLVARGEVLVLNDNFCVRVNEIVAAGKDEQ
jgi:flagellar motor switch protein FliN/FliY